MSALQKPDATNVAGIRTWNSLGRFVKRGEKGIFILAPMIGSRRSRQNEIATDINTDNTADERNPEPRLVGFRPVYVFDITQTEGKELATTLTEVSGDVSGYRERLFKFVEGQNVELSFSERITPAKGLSHGGKITLLSGMQPAEEFSTLVHEIAHKMLHRGERRALTSKQVRETEAEAVAFVVCQSIGLRNGTASQGLHPALGWRRQSPAGKFGSCSANRCRDTRGHRPHSSPTCPSAPHVTLFLAAFFRMWIEWDVVQGSDRSSLDVS